MASIDTSGLRRKVEEYGEAVVADAVQRLADEVHAVVPVDTGELRDSRFGPDQVGPYRWTFGYTAPQAEWTDQGTQSHWIEGDPLLVFYWGPPNGPGKTMFLARVFHPGTLAQRWWSDYVTPENYFSHLEGALRHSAIA